MTHLDQDWPGADDRVLCLELGCPNPPAPDRVLCAPCQAKAAKRRPLHTRPHRLFDETGHGKCDVCGRDEYDGIHPEELRDAPARHADPPELG